MSREPDVKLSVNYNEGMVVLGFNKPVREISMHQEMAMQIAEEIAKKANGAFMSQQPNSGALADQIHGKMIMRLTHIIRSMQEKGRLPGHIARECVDTIFQEVF